MFFTTSIRSCLRWTRTLLAAKDAAVDADDADMIPVARCGRRVSPKYGQQTLVPQVWFPAPTKTLDAVARSQRRRRCLNAVSESRKRRDLSQRNVDIQTARSKSEDDGQTQTTWTSQRCSAMTCAHLIGLLSSLPLTSVTLSGSRWQAGSCYFHVTRVRRV